MTYPIDKNDENDSTDFFSLIKNVIMVKLYD
jgi:hypothetical protein